MPETGQTSTMTQKKQEPTVTPQSHVFLLREAKERTSAAGVKGWDFGGGMLTTGEWVKLHESEQPAGTPHSPAHTIAHTELICVMSGEVEYFHDGVTEQAVPGDILLVMRGTNHYVRNSGAGPARYFVLAIGGDAHVG